MAPERFSKGEAVPSSDIYALTCVLYQCLTGRLPYPGEALEQIAVGHMVAPPPRPSEERDTVPAAMDAVIATGLAKKPGDRYPTATAMAAAARHALAAPANSGSPAWPDSAQTRAWQSNPDMAATVPTQFGGAPMPFMPPPDHRPRRRTAGAPVS